MQQLFSEQIFITLDSKYAPNYAEFYEIYPQFITMQEKKFGAASSFRFKVQRIKSVLFRLR